MYNLRSNKKETVQFPVQIQVDDEQFLNELLGHKSSSFNDSTNMSDSFQESSDGELDCDALLDSSDIEIHTTSDKTSKQSSSHHPQQTNSADITSDFKIQSVINSQILDQLQKIGKRLDKIENGTCKKTVDKTKIKGKSSSKSKEKVAPKLQQHIEAFEQKLPTFDSLKEDALIQSKVEQRLQELTDLAKTGTTQKIKSQRGGSVEVTVKNRVKWPHEYVLSGLNKERTSYDQLSVTQWVAGFGRTMRDETNSELREHMLEYLISLMDDANDFSWISAKASHAVLLCRMEQGEVKSYSDTLAIDRIRRANAQKHVTNSPQTLSNAKKYGKTTKSMPCTYFNQGTCVQKKSHETRGVLYKHICASCFASFGKTFPHSETDCKNKHKMQSKNE